MENFINAVSEHSIPATHKRLKEYRKVQGSDLVCKLIMQYRTEGWPDEKSVPAVVAPFGNNLLMYGQRIVIPQSLFKHLRRSILDTKA